MLSLATIPVFADSPTNASGEWSYLPTDVTVIKEAGGNEFNEISDDGKRNTGFVGAWYSDDVDGSHMWLWINNYFGAYELIWYDDGCSACNEFGNGPSCLIVSSGHKTVPHTLEIDGGKLYCYWDQGTELLNGVDVTAVQNYDVSSDQITHTNAAGYLVTWTRTNKKKPEQVIDPLPFPKP